MSNISNKKIEIGVTILRVLDTDKTSVKKQLTYIGLPYSRK